MPQNGAWSRETSSPQTRRPAPKETTTADRPAGRRLGPNQHARATVFSRSQTEDYFQQVEIRLRSTLEPHRCSGYEIFWRCLKTENAYAEIVRWNGMISAEDSVFRTGNPGIGFNFGARPADLRQPPGCGMPLTVHLPIQERQSGYLAVLAADGHQVGHVDVELRSGQFHDVILTDDVAYRFPRDPQSRSALPQRMALLTVLADARLPVAIPAPLRALELVVRERMSRPLGSCYVALSRVHGRPADAAIASDPLAAAGLTRQLADLLDRMAVAGGEPAIRRATEAASADYWLEWADQVREVLFPLMSEGGRSRAAIELAAVEEVRATGTALVHGDLGGANLLMTVASEPAGDRAPVLAGILDWDEARVGNQANDLASLAVTFGWPLTAQIEQQRQSTDASLLSSARVIAATFALQQALPAALSGDVASLDDGLMRYR